MPQHTTQNKQIVFDLMQHINSILEQKTKLTSKDLSTYFVNDAELYASEPFSNNAFVGVEAHITHFWNSFIHSFSDLIIEPYILFGDVYKDMQCVCCAGNMLATFNKDWFEIPATQQATRIRFHSHYILQNGKIEKVWHYIDTLAIMYQAGFALFPQRGANILPSAPTTQDGMVFYNTDTQESQISLNLVNSMLNALLSYDGKNIISMHQEDFWDVKNMMWYGPTGIGTTRGLSGFQKYHQIPFLTAFPNRGILDKSTQAYTAQLAEGNYVCDFGFPSMYATHAGDGWLGLKASNTRITMRVVDIWRREKERLVENWVMIDIIDILKQIGYDVFAILKRERAKKNG